VSDDRRERAQPSTSEDASLLRGPCALCSRCHCRPVTHAFSAAMQPSRYLLFSSSASRSSVHIVAFQRRHSARDRRCWWTRCSTGERGHLRDSGAPVMAPTCWTALEDDVGWRCCALRLTLSGSTLLILRLPHDHLWPPRMRNDSKTRFVPVLLDDFLFLRLLDARKQVSPCATPSARKQSLHEQIKTMYSY
jgi:hypothetical protein